MLLCFPGTNESQILIPVLDFKENNKKYTNLCNDCSVGTTTVECPKSCSLNDILFSPENPTSLLCSDTALIKGTKNVLVQRFTTRFKKLSIKVRTSFINILKA